MGIFNGVLFDYQKVAATRINEQRKVLLADQPGLGKTLEVLGALELGGLLEREATILILTPIINAQTTWRDSIVRFVGAHYKYNLVDVSKGSSTQKAKQFEQDLLPNVPTFVLANHDAIAMTSKGVRVNGIVNNFVYDAVIVDESHMVLPIKDQRKPTNFWKGLGIVKATNYAFRVAISGTPDRGKLENRYGTWKFLFPSEMKSRWEWLEDNFFITEQKVSRTRTIKATSGLKSKASWLAKDAELMIRRTKGEVLPQLPPKRYVDVELELSEAQKIAYFTQQQKALEEVFNAEVEERNTAAAMTFALRARQIVDCMWSEDENGFTPIAGGASSKLDWLMEWLSERGFIEHDDMADNSAQVVIVSQFSKVLHWLKGELNGRGIACAVLDGSTSDGRRTSIQRDFQEGSLRVVLLSGSMGVGINLDAADDLVMFDSPYDPDRVEQIEDRIHRASSNHSVTIWNLIATDSIDQAIMLKVSERYATTRTLMDGARGVEFARKILEVM